MAPAYQDDSQGGQSRILPAGAVKLRVVERGRGMPIVLVHGFPLDHSMWNAQIAALGERWHVIAPDLRGFGTSQVIAGTATMDAMADDLAALLDALAIDEPVVVVGLSMGGYVAFQFWRKYVERLRGLVLCDTRAAADTPEAAQARHALVERLLDEGMQVVVGAMLPKLLAPATLAGHSEAVEALRETMLANPAEGSAAALRGMAQRPDMTAELPKISLPTLVIVGQEDAISTVDEMRGIAKAIPESEFVVIPRCGHMTPMEHPLAFNEAIEQFLTRVERGGAAI